MSRARMIPSVFFLITLCIAPSVFGQTDYPSKPVTVVIPYPSGSLNAVMEIINEKMSQILGKPCVSSNRPGGGSAVGTVAVATSKPDGHTLLAHAGPFLSIPLTMANPPFRTNDFAPIGRMTTGDFILVVGKDAPVNNLKEFLAYVRKNTGKLSFAAGSAASLPRFGAELFKQRAKFDAQFIPYAGPPQAIPAILGGHVHFALLESRPNIGHIKSGDLKALAIFSPKRDMEYYPNVPTLVEEGFTDVTTLTFFAMFAPAKTPAPVFRKLEAALKETVLDKGVRQKLEKAEFRPDYLNSDETKAFIEGESKKWAETIKAAKLEFKE